nr:MAG TPA: hypothetical protein [Caudoviricetes sp.]
MVAKWLPYGFQDAKKQGYKTATSRIDTGFGQKNR